MTNKDKVRENRLRRTAERRGLRLEKSRRRDPQAPDYCGFMLIEPQTKSAFLGSAGFEFSASLDDVEAYLSGKYAEKKTIPPESVWVAAMRGDPAARAEVAVSLKEEMRKEKARIARGGKRQMEIRFVARSKGATAKEDGKVKAR